MLVWRGGFLATMILRKTQRRWLFFFPYSKDARNIHTSSQFLKPFSFLMFVHNLKMMQVNQVTKKTLKKNSTSVALNVQEAKYKKPKPTNPKPFRLRTDVC